MSTSNGQHRELDGLLEQWCEGRLSAGEAARLEELVLSDARATQRYLDYVALHGTLYWDTAAIGDRPLAAASSAASPKQAAQTLTLGPKAPGRRLRSRPLAAALALAAVVAVAVTVFLLPEDSSVPHVAEDNAPTAPPGSDAVGPGTDVGQEDGATPIVRLDHPQPPGGRSPGTTNETNATNPSIAATLPADDGSPVDIVAFIDGQLEATWKEHGIEPSPPANDAEWLRRISLDLTGRIPDLDTAGEFLTSDSPRKRGEAIDRLLGGDGFARHFTTVWANLLVGRSAQKTAQREGVEQFLRWQFAQNRPWNETVTQLVAADGTVQENGAAGFLLANLNNQAVPATAITARLFLCQQVQCTQCHKHPWNDWTQEQFWELNSFFQQATIERRRIKDAKTGRTRTALALADREVGGPTYYEDRRGIMQVAYPQFAGTTVDPGEDVNRREELARLLSAADDRQLARAMVNRMWAHFFGYGFTNPVDDMGPHQPISHPQLLERLTQEFAESGYDLQALIRWITSSRAYQLTSRAAETNAIDDPSLGDLPLFSRMYVKPLAPEQLFDSLLVATDAHRGGARYWSEANERRGAWLQQFFEVLENEENGETSTFDGTLPQALLMMNGPVVQRALGAAQGTVLHRILTSRSSDPDKIRQLCLATLSREPTERELNTFRRHVQQAKSRRNDPRRAAAEALGDVLWAYLNSSEFVLNH